MTRLARLVVALVLAGAARQACASPLLGAAVDGGFPDGLAASLVVRPVFPLRLEVGGSYNLLGWGLRGAAALAPIRFVIAPVLRVEVGHQLDSDAGGLAERFARLSPAERSALRRVAYDHVQAELGLELGSPDRLVFFLRAGLGYFSGTVHGFAAAVTGENASIVSALDPTVRGTYPAASAGLLFYVW